MQIHSDIGHLDSLRTRTKVMPFADWIKELNHPSNHLIRIGLYTGPISLFWKGDFKTKFLTHYFYYADKVKLEVETEGKFFEVKEKSLIAFPPGVSYRIKPAKSTIASEIYRFRFLLLKGSELITPWKEPQIFERAMALPMHFESLKSIFQKDSDHIDEQLKASIALLMCELDDLKRAPEKTELRVFKNSQIRKILNHVNDRLDQRVTPDELAKLLKISPVYFALLFKNTFRVSPRTWLVEERIRKAAGMLVETQKNVSEIAFALGYSNVNLFSRQFKKVFKLSPLQYRDRADY